MDSKPGLRERKKLRTRAAISEAAIALFLEHGFQQVPVARVAEAAEVSKRTLFAYFPTKEDLVVHRLADHETEIARVVRSRPPGTAPLAAVRGNFLGGLRERDPFTGLNDRPEVRRLHRMIVEAPSLVARMERFRTGAEHALAQALRETADTSGLTARLAAVQIVAVHWALAQDNAARMADGESADERLAGAVADAEHAFALLENGLNGPQGLPPGR
ncbi:TetR/AcrR family transcriptional regulator [Streptomyces clavuligerus]|uniref:TetR/AcrR family transcriptional regulator n=1 Tax=Streptomyces clavuligerus TaxID=1901 RepID=UPI0001851C9D|nr:TetR/AcrR family transcriptional regulator [Streptomyces clavuligerus]MBY6307408.1 TetR family transcriptional regulator [Streptomyces clavuligerus]WDN56738.1 TetR/AcrR family transcriptional regulator [Streptomyces clavuligerus]